MCMFCCTPFCLEPFMYFAGRSEWTKAFCFCMENKKFGSIWASYFTGATAIINIIINIWLLVNLHFLDGYLEDNEKWNFIPPGILGLLYIELVFNIVLFVFAFVLMIGVNRGFDGKVHMYTWIWVFGSFRWYEVFMGIYILVWLGGHRIPDVVFICPESILMTCYWLINCIILIYCIVTVNLYFKECNRDMFGKQKRARYFKMLSNIRSAALNKSQSMFSGAATPRSLFMSRNTLGGAQSQGSLSGASSTYQAAGPVAKPPPPGPSRSVLPSTASQASAYGGGQPRGPPSQSLPPQGRGYPPPQPQGGYPPPPQKQGGYPPPAQPQGGGAYPPQPQRQGYQPASSMGRGMPPQYPGAGRP